MSVFDRLMPLKSPHTSLSHENLWDSFFLFWAASLSSQSFPVFRLYLLIKSWWCRQTRHLLRVPGAASRCRGRTGAIQTQRAPVRCGETVQDVRSRAGVGVGLLRHQHLKQRADLRQEGPAQRAVLLWSFTWEEEEEEASLLFDSSFQDIWSSCHLHLSSWR